MRSKVDIFIYTLKYQMKIKERQQKLEEESKNPDIQDKELVTENSLIIANSSQKTVVTLPEQLCRVKLHDFIPEGQLPPAAHKLQIPGHIQKDLACGVMKEWKDMKSRCLPVM